MQSIVSFRVLLEALERHFRLRIGLRVLGRPRHACLDALALYLCARLHLLALRELRRLHGPLDWKFCGLHRVLDRKGALRGLDVSRR